MATPHAGVAGHGQTTCRGGLPRAAPMQGRSTTIMVAGASASKRQHSLPRPGRKGRLPVVHPHGQAGSSQLARGNHQQWRLLVARGRHRQRRGSG
ncbi:hypothetical protein B296_00006135, partial [Ensete ventricosum]